MKKKLMILAFAFGGLLMIGNNVFATDPDDGDCPEDPIGGITCHQYAEPGRWNQCWSDEGGICYFTGAMADKCYKEGVN